jgi:hypothetical protein
MADSKWDKEGESGLLDNYLLTITRSWFGTSDKYMNGERLLLNWEGTTDQLDFPTQHVWYSVGAGWVTEDGGESCVHESGPEKYFQKTSQYMKIITRCRENEGGAFDGIMDILREGDPMIASTWEGLTFRMVAEEQPAIKGEPVKPKVMPVGYEPDGAAAAPKAAVKPIVAGTKGETAAQKLIRERKAAKAAAEAGDADGGSLKDQVVSLLKTHDDFEVGQAAALELPGVMDDDDLIASLMDEEGLWAEAKANA